MLIPYTRASHLSRFPPQLGDEPHPAALHMRASRFQQKGETEMFALTHTIPAPTPHPTNCGLAPHVDNGSYVVTKPQTVDQRLAKLIQQLDNAGLKWHELEPGSGIFNTTCEPTLATTPM